MSYDKNGYNKDLTAFFWHFYKIKKQLTKVQTLMQTMGLRRKDKGSGAPPAFDPPKAPVPYPPVSIPSESYSSGGGFKEQNSFWQLSQNRFTRFLL